MFEALKYIFWKIPTFFLISSTNWLKIKLDLPNILMKIYFWEKKTIKKLIFGGEFWAYFLLSNIKDGSAQVEKEIKIYMVSLKKNLKILENLIVKSNFTDVLKTKILI